MSGLGPINLLVVDLSHHDPADDYSAAKDAGIAGVIFKATQGPSFRDPDYLSQRAKAKAAGLLWGAFHFADASPVDAQVLNFFGFASLGPGDLFCLDYEDNGANSMSLSQAKAFITGIESMLERPNECVLYSGNRIKETIGSTTDPFWAQHRLWIAHYTSPAKVVWPKQWVKPWLWQYSDGDIGADPHTVAGIGPCDCNSFDGTVASLTSQWSGGTGPTPVPPVLPTVTITISAPPGVEVNVIRG